MSVLYELSDLLYLMRRLRDRDGGCPWDIEQNFESIAPHTLEEAYEVVDCIERGDFDHLREELGDLLFQVVYHSQMASEENRFTFGDVVETLVAKLIARHPHVFPSGDLFATNDLPAESQVDVPAHTADSTWVRGRWEERKAEERARKKGDSSALADIPTALPGLSRLQKLQKRANRAGFPSRGAAAVLRNIALTAEQLSQTLSAGDMVAEEQIVELLFDCADFARLVSTDAERAARRSGREFERLFRALEATLQGRGESLETLSLEQKERYWSQLKQPLE